MTFVATLLVGALALSACGGDDDEGSGSGGGTASAGASSDLKIGLAYDIGGRGDKSFNDSAAVGLDKFVTEKGVKKENVRELEARSGDTDTQRAQRLELLAKAGFNPIIAVGFVYAKALGEIAPKYPDVKFAIVDGTEFDVKGANISNLVFAEEQGSYLVGAVAALKSKTGSIGFVGGCDTPLIHKFEAGYKAGAAKIKADVKVASKYLSTTQQNCSGFNDPSGGKEAAKGMYDGGADVVYQAAGGSGGGVFEAAQEAGKQAIGVDSDQYLTADAKVKDVIITSMIKRVDTAVYTFLTEADGGTAKAGEQRFGLKDQGIAFSTSGGAIDDIKTQIDALQKQIVDGTITVPTS